MGKIDFKKIMKYDGYMRMLLINGIIFSGIGIYLVVSKVEVGIVSYIFYAVALISFVGLILRYIYLSNFKVKLISAQATILRIFYNRGVKIMTCTYIIDGVTYKKRYSVNYTPTTRNYKKEDVVDILAKESNPKQSLIKDLYFE